MVARVTRMTKRRLGELLRAEGLVTEDQVQAALVEQRKSNLFLGEAMVKLGFVTEEAIASTIAQQFNLPYIASEQYQVDKAVLDVFPESLAWEYQFLPLERIGPVLIIVGSGLMNHDVLSELERISGCKICQFVGTWNDIRRALDEHFKDRKKDDDADLTSLGKMLLEGDSDDDAGVIAPVEESELAQDLAEAVGSNTGLEEALAAVGAQVQGLSDDQLESGVSNLPSDDDDDTPLPPVAVPAPAAQSDEQKPAASARFPNTSGRLSAFAGNAPKLSKSGINKAASPAGGEDGQAADGDGQQPKGGSKKGPPTKGGLLGFLKK